MPNTKPFGNFSEDLLARLKAYYLANPGLSMEAISELSEQLVGQHVPSDRLKVYAKNDKTGNWFVERNRREGAGQTNKDIIEEIHNIRRMVYEQLVSSHQSGLLLLGDFDHDEVTLYLAKRFPNIDFVEIRPGSIDPALINAYMGLLSKSKANLDITSSAKTSYEQALELARKAVDGHKPRSLAD